MTRRLQLESGSTWDVRVVARLVSEDTITLARSGRLIVRLDRCDAPVAAERLAVLRGESLEEFDDDTLRSLVDERPEPALRRAR